jgi:translocation and assembly module TamB
VRFAVEPFAFEVSETGPIAGTAAWQGSVDSVWQLLPIDAFLLSGHTDVNLAIGGTIRRPAVTGDMTLTRGSFEVFETGTVLRPLDIAITAAQSEVRLARLEARDGGEGTLTGTGTVVLGDPMRLDVRLAMGEFTAVRRDDVVSRLNGAVAVDGALGERMLVSGRIENAETEVRLVNRLPPQVTTVPVVFVDEAPEAAPTPVAPAAQAEAPPIDLDLTIDLPGRVYVRGRGLSSEWAGSFVITGTSAKPQVRGSLHPVRGTFDLLGKTFILDKGKIGIEGLDRDIAIDLTAVYQRSNFKALVHVSGTAKEPKITLESEPELPQDEILARVLFDKSTGKLSALEAAQLAAAAAAMASGEPGVLDKLRDTTGLDQLRLGGTEEGSAVPTVEAGKYVDENVYVGVEQGASAGSTAAVVEVDITENIKLRSTTSAEGSNRVGVQWEWQY